MGDGRIRAMYGPGDEADGSLSVEFFDVDLGRVEPLRSLVGLPVVGSVSGTISLEYGDEWRLDGGNIELGIVELRFGPGEIQSEAFRQFGGAVPLPETDFGNVVIRAPIEGSDVQIEQFEASGSDIRINASGEFQLRRPWSTSRAGLNIDVQLDGGYVEEAGLGAVLGLPELQRLQVGDGYALSVSGPLGRPSVVAGTRGGR